MIKYFRLAAVIAAVLVSACSKSVGPNEDSQQAAQQAQAMLAQGGSADGKSLYGACVACHGDKGQGNAALGAPSLTNQQSWYIQRQLEYFKNGTRGTHPEDAFGDQMRALASSLDEAAMASLADYIDGFSNKPATATLQGNVKRGADYYSNLCGACHGPEAEGNELLSAPALAGVDDWYLLRQFKHFENGLRGADESEKYAYQMGLMGKVLPDADVARDVIVYIQSLAD
ncbi:c-type cytochrome [Spongiibacter sp. KMU-158]|uniref:C-type cytochrome n=1 Tax=Spongiibacter pelagi TaxID=2760804 RepID=A0A927BZE4_9GAMM|nr:c-type cytochrome [Spongiibacter pelagi]MBD2857859.1 c-type cytochrome [Spongiibacter pelagi]